MGPKNRTNGGSPVFKYLYHLSLYQSGKSRADLWQFAGLVALEQLIERSNRACDLDYHQRQQVRLLEGREKCEIKLTKPLKFMTGRKDCITDRKRTYKTGKKEVFLKTTGLYTNFGSEQFFSTF